MNLNVDMLFGSASYFVIWLSSKGIPCFAYGHWYLDLQNYNVLNLAAFTLISNKPAMNLKI